jgi:ubiquinone biosynthesis protein UbiJ
LVRLGHKIPGFAGFQYRELRREVDRQLREQLASELRETRRALGRKAAAYTDAGQLSALTPFDRLDRRLDGLAQEIRYAVFGATGFFDAVKIGEAELARLYEFDHGFVEELATLAGEVAAVPGPGGGSPSEALEVASQHLEQLQQRWAGREQVVLAAVPGV